MKKQSQTDWVMGQLEKHGSVSRNHALGNYISRLSSIIFNLKAEGLDIDGEDVYFTRQDGSRGTDYVYKLRIAH